MQFSYIVNVQINDAGSIVAIESCGLQHESRIVETYQSDGIVKLRDVVTERLTSSFARLAQIARDEAGAVLWECGKRRRDAAKRGV